MKAHNLYIIFLRFTENKEQAPQFMKDHLEWIEKGLDDNIFLLAGGLLPNLGGTILAHNSPKLDLIKRMDTDPFVKEKIVSYEVFEVSPTKIHSSLKTIL